MSVHSKCPSPSTIESTILPLSSKDREDSKAVLASSVSQNRQELGESSTQRTFCDRQTGKLTARRDSLKDSVAGSQDTPLLPDTVDLLAKATHGLSLDSDVEGKQPEGHPPYTGSFKSLLGEEQVVLSPEEEKLQSGAFLAGMFGLDAPRLLITECMEMKANLDDKHSKPRVLSLKDDIEEDHSKPVFLRQDSHARSSASSSVDETDFDFFPDPLKAEDTARQPLDLADEDKRRRGSSSFKIQPAADESTKGDEKKHRILNKKGKEALTSSSADAKRRLVGDGGGARVSAEEEGEKDGSENPASGFELVGLEAV